MKTLTNPFKKLDEEKIINAGCKNHDQQKKKPKGIEIPIEKIRFSATMQQFFKKFLR